MNEDMKLPEGKTCTDCEHIKRCTSMFGVNATDTECDFGPSRFVEANRPVDRVVIARPKLPSLKLPRSEPVVSDEMVNYYFEGTNFGGDHSTEHRRKLLANGVLKNQAGWWNGHTLFQIMKRCDLVTEKGNITKRGKLFIWEYFSSSNV